MIEYGFPILAIIVLVILNGLFVAAEFALVGSRLSRLEALAERGSGAASWLVDVFTKHAGKDGYIAVAQLGITLASIGLGMYGEPAVAHWLYEPLEDLGVSHNATHTVGFVIALGAITFLHVVLGEMIPKALALQAPESVSVKLNPLMRSFSTLFRPMVAALNWIAFALMRMLRIPEPDKSLSLHTSDELAIVTDESAHSGQLGELQRDLIRNIFELDERPAEEIMIQRSSIVAIQRTAGAAEISALLASSVTSRYPVIDGDLDHVVGMLHVKDFIRAKHTDSFESVEAIVRPLPVVAATTSADDLLEQFKLGSTHAALVIDEYGSTVGFVSLDDVIAEVLDDDDAEVVHNDDGTVTAPGQMPLRDLSQVLDDPTLINDDIVTIAGHVLAHAGSVPEVGASVDHSGRQLTVGAVDGRTITSVIVGPRAEPVEASSDDATAH